MSTKVEVEVKAPKVKFSGADFPIFNSAEKLQSLVDGFNEAPQLTPMTLATFIVLFCARKQEAHSLNIENGYIVGCLKKRGEGQDQHFPLTVVVTHESAVKFLENLRKFPAEQITAAIRKLESCAKEMGFVNCSKLRDTGAWLIEQREEDHKKQVALRRLALRSAPPKPKKPSQKRRMAETFKELTEDEQRDVFEYASNKRQKH